MENFQPGDTVQLKSGGPVMTVHETDEEGVLCDWFLKGKREMERFPATSLKKVQMGWEEVSTRDMPDID